MFFNVLKDFFGSNDATKKTASSNKRDESTNSKDECERLILKEFKKIETYLSDFFKESTNSEFNEKLLKGIKKLAEEIANERQQKTKDDANEEFDEMMDILNDKTRDSSTKKKAGADFDEVLKKKVDSFFSDFMSKDSKPLFHFTSEMNLYLKVSDGGKYCVSEKDAFSNKGKKKIENAVKSFAYSSSSDREYPSVPHDFIALFDTSVFGSAGRGMLFTHDSIYCKGLGDDRVRFRLKDVKKIRVRDDELIINGTTFQFFHSEIKSRLRLVVAAIDEYINQPGYILKRYIENKKHPYASA